MDIKQAVDAKEYLFSVLFWCLQLKWVREEAAWVGSYHSCEVFLLMSNLFSLCLQWGKRFGIVFLKIVIFRLANLIRSSVDVIILCHSSSFVISIYYYGSKIPSMLDEYFTVFALWTESHGEIINRQWIRRMQTTMSHSHNSGHSRAVHRSVTWFSGLFN